MGPRLFLFGCLLAAGCGGDAGRFPAPPPVADADPAAVHPEVVRVPKAIVVTPGPDRLEARWDMTSLEDVTLEVGSKMILGTEVEYRVYRDGDEAGQSYAMTLTSATEFRAADVELFPGFRSERIDARVTIFQTDIPPQHMWSPTSGRYAVLCRRVIGAK